MIPFNYHHLYYFYIVAKEHSFSKAARTLHVSQPALSAQLKQFESYWDLKLFNRDSRNVTLTEEGSMVFNYSKAIFDLGQELADTVVNRKHTENLRIQLGTSSSVPKAIVEALVRFIYHCKPTANLILRQDKIDNMIEDLMVHKLDLVINDFPYETPFEQGIQNHLAGTIPMVFCVSKGLASKFANIPKDLNGAPLILPTAPDRTYHAMQNYIHANKIKPKIIAEIQDLELGRMFVAMGKGIGLLNSYAVLNCPERKELVILKDRSKLKINDTIYLINRERKIPHPLITQVVEDFRLS
ncbi:MAG TPA: LysR family transcriptional regulator [Candidatus Omnitrophota bacterium]|nr:LysR family transcriptional regulator [Candidatus Omnitrophota bacterium]